MIAALVIVACSPKPEAQLRRAAQLQADGKFAESIAPVKAALEDRPEDPEANFRLGVALVQTGKPHLAVWPLEQAAAHPDYGVQAGLLLTTAFQQTRSYQSAIAAATRVLEQAPNSISARVLRGMARESARKLAEALEDADAILERKPRHFQALLLRGRALTELGRLEEAEPALVALRDVALESDDPAAPAACLFLTHFYENRRHDQERAERSLLRCLDAFPDHLLVLSDMLRFFDAAGDSERATQLLREGAAQAVDHLAARTILAQRLLATEQTEEAAKLLRESAEALNSPGAWSALANFYVMEGDLARAREASGRAVAADRSGNERLRFAQAEILIDSGEIEEAERIADSLQEPAYRDLLRGHLLYERGDAVAAREALEAGLQLWPSQPGARRIAGQVALELGDFEAAESHFLEAVRATQGQSEAVVDLVRLLLARGDARRALHFARMGAKFPQRRTVCHLLAAQAAAALGNAEEARDWLKPLLELPEQRSAALVALAAVERQSSGPAAAAELLEENPVDPADPGYERVLRLLVESLLDSGKASLARARVDAALARDPGSVSLHDLRGRMLLRLGRREAARAEFETALAKEPDSAEALEGLALVLEQEGEIERAIELLDRAARSSPEEERFAYRASQLLRRTGREQEALERLREIARRFPGAGSARNDLAWLLAERNRELDFAEELASQAVRSDPRSAFLDTLGWVRLKRGRAREAVASLERAVAANPDSARIRYHLGLALAAAGQPDRALPALREALDGGLHDEAASARAKIAELEQAASRAR